MSIILNALRKIERNYSIDMDPVARQEIAQEHSSFLKKRITKWLVGILMTLLIFFAGFLLAKKELYSAPVPVKEASITATTVTPPLLVTPPVAPTPAIAIEKPLPLTTPALPSIEGTTPVPMPEITPNLVPTDNKTTSQKDIIQSDGTSPLTLLNIITQLISTNQVEHALALLSTYQDQTSSYLSVVKQLGVSLTDGNRNDTAIQILNSALLRYPEEIEVRQYLASAQMGQGKYTEAIKTLLINQPDITQHAPYYALLAALYVKTSDFKDAIPLYEALTQTEPENPNYFLGLAIAYQNLGQETMAQTYYNKSLTLAPNTWASRGFVLNQLQSSGYEVE